MRNGLALVLIASIALAPGAATAASPYAGWQGREVKSLSDRQIEDYLKGNGMGLALPAELNHYPGPRHVLALAEDLALTAAQRTVVTALEARMSEEAIALGKTVIAREADLDALFAQGRASEEGIEALTMRIGGLKGRLRATHLKYHLSAST